MTAHNVIPFTRPPHIADARAELVKHARAILRRPDRHSHEDVLTACYYAKQFGDEDDKALAKRARQDAAESLQDDLGRILFDAGLVCPLSGLQRTLNINL